MKIFGIWKEITIVIFVVLLNSSIAQGGTITISTGEGTTNTIESESFEVDITDAGDFTTYEPMPEERGGESGYLDPGSDDFGLGGHGGTDPNIDDYCNSCHYQHTLNKKSISGLLKTMEETKKEEIKINCLTCHKQIIESSKINVKKIIIKPVKIIPSVDKKVHIKK